MIKKHTAPQGGKAAALPANCAKCRDNFPLPVAMDYFDQRVIADYTQRRTACTAVPDAEKPCLSAAIDRAVEPALSGRSTDAQLPAPAATTTAPTLADFEAWMKAEEQRLLDAMDAAVAADDASTYEALHAQFLDLGSTFEVLWKFKTTMRYASTSTPESAA
ncbi:hypothetical protein [Simplicispira psychrophila]|uniref:hypothetical protein n=1 Tax=Simplicispira psychrophila TaxID=80882 RepID=UPI0004869F00|nr:hypothetical protein [Simplicispira psychrophila]